MKIRILTVGKIKEKFYRDAIAEYQKRLGRYCKLEIVEVADEKTDENARDVYKRQGRIRHCKDAAYADRRIHRFREIRLHQYADYEHFI